MKPTVILVITGVVLLSGCDSPKVLTRAEVIAAVKECREGGMKPQIMMHTSSYAPTAVHCVIEY